jgi:hypothetical protein
VESGPEAGGGVDGGVVEVAVGAVEGEELARDGPVGLGAGALEAVATARRVVREEGTEVLDGALGRDRAGDAVGVEDVGLVLVGVVAADGLGEEVERLGPEAIEVAVEARVARRG